MRRPWPHRVAVVLAWLCLTALPARAEDVLAIEPLADEVPKLALVSAQGGAVLTNTELLGRFVLLHFWATWCTPCKDELPALDSLAASLDPARFVVVLVAVDDNATAAEVAAFARELGVHLPAYVARASGVSDSFWGWGLPVSYLIDDHGYFIGRLRGPRAWSAPVVRKALAALQAP